MAKQKLNLSSVISKYIGVPYKLGGRDLSGMDCLMMVNSIGRELGIKIPKEYRGITEENYSKLWSEFPEQAKFAFISYVLSLGEKVDNYCLFPPDLVLFKDGKGVLGAGIYVGNGLILSSFVGDSVGLVNKRNYPIEAVIRWAAKERG